MILKIISAILILSTTFLAIKHSWPILNNDPESLSMFSTWNVSKALLKSISILTLAGGVLILFPKTFFWGNYLNAAIIVFMMMQFLRVGDIKHLLIEIPFLAMPFILLYLKHPLAER